MWRSEDNNWSILLDVEGFSASYAEDQAEALVLLGRLMEAVHAVGCTTLAMEPDRLFAHQVGDGFIVVPSFGEESLEKPVTLAIVALRHVLAGGGTARAALSTGGFADIQGCYPRHVMEARLDDDLVLGMGEGLMTIFPVMGAALINSYRLGSRAPRGALFVADQALAPFLPDWINQIPLEDSEQTLVLDWVHAHDNCIDQMAGAAQLDHLSRDDCDRRLLDYVENCSASGEWKTNTGTLCRLNEDSG